LYVSHNMATIRQLCDRCIVMDQGKIAYDGSVEDAIAVYMNLGMQDDAVDIDLTHRSLLRPELQTTMKLHRVKLLDKVHPTYAQGEDLNLRLSITVLNPVEDVVFRTTIINDTDTPLGTSWTPAMTFASPGDYELDVRMPMGFTARGTFYMNISFNILMFGGGNRIIAGTDRAFKIEVTGKSFWRINTRGYFVLPESSVVRTERIG
ncbi:MAG: hypothetical protein IKD62_00800, partial [Oscillospiraceae bacterium]|nr:hypothetical protein [Oscillospiraceae bacterium]